MQLGCMRLWYLCYRQCICPPPRASAPICVPHLNPPSSRSGYPTPTHRIHRHSHPHYPHTHTHTHAAPPPPLTPDAPPGKGKFSTVYRASRLADGQRCALKKIAILDMMDEKQREKCLKEVRLLQSLDHPNIIKYMDSFIDENELIIVFEWAEAGDLKRQIRKAIEKKARFDERVVWKYFSQICEALHHMHERRIMHRDLKPANIFLMASGCVKVGDLGLGRSLSENTLQAHSKVGTPLYMSPEVLRGGGYDWKSDTWSLGCILYELAVLKSPFKEEGLNLYALFQKISKGEFAPVPSTYSDELRNLCTRMVNVNAAQRPEMDEVCQIAATMRRRTEEARRAARAAQAAAAQGASAAEGGAAGRADPTTAGTAATATTVGTAEGKTRSESKSAHAPPDARNAQMGGQRRGAEEATNRPQRLASNADDAPRFEGKGEGGANGANGLRLPGAQYGDGRSEVGGGQIARPTDGNRRQRPDSASSRDRGDRGRRQPRTEQGGVQRPGDARGEANAGQQAALGQGAEAREDRRDNGRGAEREGGEEEEEETRNRGRGDRKERKAPAQQSRQQQEQRQRSSATEANGTNGANGANGANGQRGSSRESGGERRSSGRSASREGREGRERTEGGRSSSREGGDRRSGQRRVKNGQSDGTGGGKSSAPASGGSKDTSGEALMLMRGITERMQVLTRREDSPCGPLSVLHFAIDLQGGGTARTAFRTRQQQFHDFVKLMAWLLKKLGHDLLAKLPPSAGMRGDGELQLDGTAPNVVATCVLNVAGAAGVSAAQIGSVSPLSLTTGYGSAVCSVLHWTLDRVISTVKPTIGRPNWRKIEAGEVAEEMIDTSANEERDAGNMASGDETDSINSDVDEAEHQQASHRALAGGGAGGDDNGHLGMEDDDAMATRGPVPRRASGNGFKRALRQQMITGGPSGVSVFGEAAVAWQRQWRSECEHVYPLLNRKGLDQARKARQGGGGDGYAMGSALDDWRERFTVLGRYAEQVHQWTGSGIMPSGTVGGGGGGGVGGGGGGRGGGSKGSGASLGFSASIKTMERLAQQLHKEAESIESR